MYPFNAHGSERKDISLDDLLAQCATNLTAAALAPVFGRDNEIDQVLTSLGSPLKGRILVTGEARVGKTAVLHGVANRIVRGECPEVLRESHVWRLSPRSILRAFGVRGWQEGLGMMMEKWGRHPEIILYLDALPTMMLAGATMEDPFDMAQFLLGQFQNSNSRILAEGRTHQIQSFLEAYPEYRHVLLEVRVAEPPLNESAAIVRQAVPTLTANGEVAINYDAIEMAIDVTRRFALQEALPGKALDLIGEAIALRTAEEGEERRIVAEDDIIQRFTDRTGLPRMLLTDDEPFDEDMVRRHFNNAVLGQEQAVDIVVQALSLLRTRLNNPQRPMGVFLFIGPTGVGKTELARVLSRFLFGSDDVIVRFNMADYTQEWHTNTLFGDPHGYSLEARRGQFTTRLQDKAFAVVLLDEFEKANPEIYQHFLQLFDEGIHINGASEVVNLRNSIVILTSNFGAQMLAAQRIGFGPSTSLEEQERQIREEIVRFFSPEFINRIDNVCFFKPLTKYVLREIAYRRVHEVLQREGITRRGLQVEIEDDVIEWVVEHGYSERYGARYLARQIEKTITYPLAQQVIRNEPPKKSVVRLFLHNEQVASALSLPERDNTVPEETSPTRLSLESIKADLPKLAARVTGMENHEEVVQSRSELRKILQRMSTLRFWDEPERIQQDLQTMQRLATNIEMVDGLRRNLDELTGLLNLANPTEDLEALTEATNRYRYLVSAVQRTEIEVTYHSPLARQDAFVVIRPVGRRDVARAWAVELVRMYQQWAARSGIVIELLGEDWRYQGGGAVLHMKASGVSGNLMMESGRHRLITEDGHTRYIQAQVQVIPNGPFDWNPYEVTISTSRLGAPEGTALGEVARFAVTVRAEDDTLVLLRADEPDATVMQQFGKMFAAITMREGIIRDYDRREGVVTDRRRPDARHALEAVLAGQIGPLIAHANQEDELE